MMENAERIDEIIVSEENATEDGINNQWKRGRRPKNVSQKECEKINEVIKPKKRGCRPKNVSQKECEKEDDVLKPEKRGCRPKNVSQKEFEKEDDVFKPEKRGRRSKMCLKRNVKKKMMCLNNPKEAGNLNVTTQ